MIISGFSFSARIKSQMENSAVGALPMAKISGLFSRAAFSMDTSERVTPRSLASRATSSSPMKQRACPPNWASSFLLMPDWAMVVSVITSQPARMASIMRSTACSEKQRLS